ncbi:MAG: 3'-5' exonuclease [bacterium]
MIVNKQYSYNKDHFIIFDFETTGLTDNDEIIEYAFLEFKNNELVANITSLIKPSVLISDLITNITGISNKDVMNKSTIDKHIDAIANFIDGKDLVAHNVSFDLRFLNKIMINKNITINAIDSISVIKSKVKHNTYKLDFLREHYNINLVNHRAYDDCLIVKAVLDKVL